MPANLSFWPAFMPFGILTETFSVGWPNAHHRVLKSCVSAVNSFEGKIVGERDLAGVKKPIFKGSIALPTINTTGNIEAMALYPETLLS